MKKKKILVILLIILTLIAVGFFAINKYTDLLLNKVNIEENVDQNEIIDSVVKDETNKAHEVVNFMLVGADNPSKKYNSYNENRSDALKIISLDYTDKKIKITSLNKDVVVWIPNKNEFGRFGWSYAYGGATYAIKTINYNLDLDISKYVSFSFAAFIDIIDEIGGIDIELTKEEAKAMNNPAYGSKVSIKAKEGINHLHGNDALTYARINYLDSDFVRMDRQNKVIKATIDKLKSSSLEEVIKVINVCLPNITTNLTIEEIKSYLSDVVKFDLNDIQTQTYPKNCSTDVSVNKNEIGGYILKSYSNQVIELHKFIFGTKSYEPTQTIYDNENKTYNEVCEFYEKSETSH